MSTTKALHGAALRKRCWRESCAVPFGALLATLALRECSSAEAHWGDLCARCALQLSALRPASIAPDTIVNLCKRITKHWQRARPSPTQTLAQMCALKRTMYVESKYWCCVDAWWHIDNFPPSCGVVEVAGCPRWCGWRMGDVRS